MPTYHPDDLAAAVLGVQGGQPFAEAAKQYGIPRSTLFSRLKGCQPRVLGAQCLQCLEPSQETALAQWACLQASLGCVLSPQNLTYLAQQIFEAIGRPTRTGQVRLGL